MTTLADSTDLHERLRALLDRGEIKQLCDRYISLLDSGRDDDSWLPSIFAPEAHIVFPFGEYHGIDGLVQFQAMARGTFQRTHHSGGNYVVEVMGDRGTLHGQLTAVHVRERQTPAEHFDIGGHLDLELIRLADGWRIQRLTFDLVWTSGTGPKV